MKLHEDRKLFKELSIKVYKKYRIESSMVEKDYYTFFFLKELVKLDNQIIFKGGTSLSKCFHVIDRFSEDIDISYIIEEKATHGTKVHLNHKIKDIVSKSGLKLLNSEHIYSNRDFNRYLVDFNPIFTTTYLNPNLIIEVSLFSKIYPTLTKTVSSYIYEYLKDNQMEDLIKKYELEPFEIKTQSLERTLVDKLFAIVDYDLKNNIEFHSRHLYDIYKIYPNIKIDNKFLKLFNDVKKDRQKDKESLSAQPNFNLKEGLLNLINKETYKKDYQTNTKYFLYQMVPYEETIKTLKKIINKTFK